ncbi:MAG: alpha/beta hydrolase [Fimbriimonadaceae bacterium]|nr:alpha/beta hydrolase [Fimbriimonadaceae bacterium]QYK59198.1 MAG: alpha/beta hydrolase [Fimbriimonadaceae bacterium]
MTVRQDLSFKTPKGSGRYDLFVPDSPGARRLVVLIHGGGWVSGDKSGYHDEALFWTDQGLAAACVGYRLAPTHPFPAAVIDVQGAMAHFRASGDWDEVFVFGNSAGGHLALMAGLCDHILGSDLPASPADKVVAVCPITDLRSYSGGEVPEAEEFLDAFMGAPPGTEPEKWTEASPVAHVRPGAPPTLLIHGQSDSLVPVSQSRVMAEALQAVGALVRLIELSGEEHSFTWEAWSRIRREAREHFLGGASS